MSKKINKQVSATVYQDIPGQTPVETRLALSEPRIDSARTGDEDIAPTKLDNVPAIKDLTFDYSEADLTSFLTGVLPDEEIPSAVETIQFLKKKEKSKSKKTQSIDSSELENIIKDIPIDVQLSIKNAISEAIATISDTDSSIIKTVELPLKKEREKVELIFLINSDEDTRIFSPQIKTEKKLQINVETNTTPFSGGITDNKNLIKTEEFPTLLIPHEYKGKNNQEALVSILEYLCEMFPDVLSLEEVEYYSPDNETAKAIAFISIDN